MSEDDQVIGFNGFEEPTENWSKLPNAIIEALPTVTSLGELKVILYTLRHTWGFHDDWKIITLEEFMNGRKRRDGTRFDNGTGLSRNSIRDGIKSAVEHGFIQVMTDDTDKARTQNAYSLTTSKKSEGQKLTPGGSEVDPHLSEVDPRTEKETKERKNRNNSASVAAVSNPPTIEEPEPIEEPAPVVDKKQSASAIWTLYGGEHTDVKDGMLHELDKDGNYTPAQLEVIFSKAQFRSVKLLKELLQDNRTAHYQLAADLLIQCPPGVSSVSLNEALRVAAILINQYHVTDAATAIERLLAYKAANNLTTGGLGMLDRAEVAGFVGDSQLVTAATTEELQQKIQDEDAITEAAYQRWVNSMLEESA